MSNVLATSIRAAAVTLVLTGILYPLAVWGIAQAVFPRQANGSFVTDETGASIGSHLIGQAFTNPGYLQSRPSAAGTAKDGHDVEFVVSSGSNYGPTSAKLRGRAASDAARLETENTGAPGPVPAELVTTSGSGLDPHLSPAAAEWQAPRIAAARGVSVDRVRAVIAEHVEGRDLGFLGEPRVNVLRLNLALDGRFGPPPREASISPK